MDLVAGQGLKVSRQADNLLPTVTTSEANEVGAHGDGGQDLRTTVDALLPTPSVAHLRNHDEDIDGYLKRRQDFVDGKTLGMPGASLGVAVRMQAEGIELLPTVTTQDGKNNGGPSQADRNTPPPEFHSIILFPTPVAAEGLKAPAQQNSKTKSKTGQVWLSNIAKDIEEANEQPTTNT